MHLQRINQIVDVSNFEAINKNLIEIESSHKKIDIFINNAGITGINTTLEEYPIRKGKRN
jgi:3-oxoacyl-[acyl-carrier protein] reductase